MPSMFDFSNWPVWLAALVVTHLVIVVTTVQTKKTDNGWWWFLLVVSALAGFATTFGFWLSATDVVPLSSANPVAAGGVAFLLGCLSFLAAIVTPLVTIAGTRKYYRVQGDEKSR